MMVTLSHTSFFPGGNPAGEKQGLRPNAGGTHTSRTLMVPELAALLSVIPEPYDRSSYAEAIIADNRLGKATASTRRITNTRLGEIYALDPHIPIFRILRHVWKLDETARPLLALLVGLARDPLLLATASVILPLHSGDELPRTALRARIDEVVSDRLNPSILDKVMRNTASSWTQSGHLTGRTFKHRCMVQPTPASVSFALWIACQAGFPDTDAFGSGWVRSLDCDSSRAMELATEARRLGLIGMNVAEQVVTLDFGRLGADPWRR